MQKHLARTDIPDLNNSGCKYEGNFDVAKHQARNPICVLHVQDPFFITDTTRMLTQILAKSLSFGKQDDMLKFASAADLGFFSFSLF
jgi:hypothetical protein